MAVCVAAMASTTACTIQKRRSRSRCRNRGQKGSVAWAIGLFHLLQAQQTRLHGEDHRLGAGTHLELGEDTPQMPLYRSHAQSQGPGDLLVRVATRDQRHDLGFAFAQSLPCCRLVPAVQPGQEPAEDPAGDLGAEDRVTLMGAAYRCR